MPSASLPSVAASACPPSSLPLHLQAQGDWGTQFGMLIQYIAEKRPEGLNAASDEDVADLQVWVRERGAGWVGGCTDG
jgi:hypothetical protein